MYNYSGAVVEIPGSESQQKVVVMRLGIFGLRFYFFQMPLSKA